MIEIEIEIEATVNLPGLRRGRVAWTNPKVPYVALCLEAGFVIATGRQRDRLPHSDEEEEK